MNIERRHPGVVNWMIDCSLEPHDLSGFHIVRRSKYILYSSLAAFQLRCGETVSCIIDGYIIPAMNAPNKYQHLKNYALVDALYSDVRTELLNFIKGEFCLVICHKDYFIMLTDHLGMKKFFFTEDRSFMATNSIKLLPSDRRTAVDSTAVILNSFFYHYVEGKTFIEGIKYSNNAHMTWSDGSVVRHSKYWNYDRLTKATNDSSASDIGNTINEVIRKHLELFSDLKPSITLTGGIDSRVVLSSLLKNGVNPTVCTYGNPVSGDVIVSSKICKQYKLSMHNPNVKAPNSQWFEQISKETIRSSNSLSSIFRAYRNHAMRKFVDESESQMLFTGYVGGEGIRGYSGNNYYECGILRELVHMKEGLPSLLNQLDGVSFINKKDISPDLFSSLSFIHQGDYLQTSFEYIYNVIARLHHGADVTLYNQYLEHIVNPYLDIDYLSVLHGSQMSFLHPKKTLSRKLNNFSLYTALIKQFYPRLLEIPLSNGYKLATFDKNKLVFLWYLSRRKKSKSKVIGFTYEKWFEDYIRHINVNLLPDDLRSMIDVDRYTESLNKTHENNESYWQKYVTISSLVEMCKIFMSQEC